MAEERSEEEEDELISSPDFYNSALFQLSYETPPHLSPFLHSHYHALFYLLP